MAWAIGEDLTAARLAAESGGQIMARAERATVSTGTTTTTATSAQGVLRIDDITLRAGRLYRVAAPSLGLYSSTSGDVAVAQLTRTTDGSTPTASSTRLTHGRVEAFGTSVVHTCDLHAVYAPGGADVTFSVLLSIYRQSGSGTIQAYGAADWPILLLIEDLGVDPGDTGTDL
jgi:hypothetical protein